MIRDQLAYFAPFLTVTGFLVGLPTVIGTYYQSLKARQEARKAREETLHSRDCLEFVSSDGTTINLVPLETLHSLPLAGDVLLLPGDGVSEGARFLPGAYRVESIEHIYTPIAWGMRPNEARLTKAVARVTSVSGSDTMEG